ncbi:unnamed protein product [Parajaminaea phylloscopi]
MESTATHLAPVQLQPSHTLDSETESPPHKGVFVRDAPSDASARRLSHQLHYAIAPEEGALNRHNPSPHKGRRAAHLPPEALDVEDMLGGRAHPRNATLQKAAPPTSGSEDTFGGLDSLLAGGGLNGDSLYEYHISGPEGFHLAPITPAGNSPVSSPGRVEIEALRRASFAGDVASDHRPLSPPSTSAKASSSSDREDSTATTGKMQPQQPSLKKQQACLTCKRRKTRCDAVRPTCGACSRSQARAARGHALTAEVPPGPCTFPDDEPGLSVGGPQRQTERRNSSTALPRPAKKQKRNSVTEDPASAPTTSSSSGSHVSPNGLETPSIASDFARASSDWPTSSEQAYPEQALVNTSAVYAPSAHTRTERLIIEVQSRDGQPSRVRRFYSSGNGNSIQPSMNPNTQSSPLPPSSAAPDGLDFLRTDGLDLSSLPDVDLPQVDLLLRQIWPELSPDLPTPETIRHMAELFFAKHPCRTMFCKSTMIARLMLPPGHPLRPHSSLIHAILAAAEPFSPLVPSMKETNPSTLGTDQRQSTSYAHPMPPFDHCGNLGFVPSQCPPNVTPATMESIGRGFVGLANPFETPRPEIQRDISFGEFHLGKARREIEVALLTQNQRPLEWLQAGILVNYCLLERCRIMESFFIGACTVRTLAPSGFDKMPNNKSEAPTRGMVEFPSSSIVEYEQRMGVWQVYLMDIYSAGPPKFYEPCIADEKEQITTTIPVLMDDVEDDTMLTLSEQTLKSPDLFRIGHTDTFCLHVKSACLLKQARLITSRRGASLAKMPRPPEEVIAVDGRIREFLHTFPKRPQDIDVDWIVAEANVCVAHITLHQHFVGSALNANSTYGRGPIEAAVETMLQTVHLLLATSYDTALLHTQVFICWVVLVRVLEVKSRMLTRFWQTEAAQQALASVESVMQALRLAADRNWRAKTSLEICQACIDDELSDDEFADLVFLWQVIPS